MELWQLDVTGSLWLITFSSVPSTTGEDDHARFVVIGTVARRATGRAVCGVFAAPLGEFGCPDQELTEHGKQFTGKFNKPRPARSCSTGSVDGGCARVQAPRIGGPRYVRPDEGQRSPIVHATPQMNEKKPMRKIITAFPRLEDIECGWPECGADARVKECASPSCVYCPDRCGAEAGQRPFGIRPAKRGCANTDEDGRRREPQWTACVATPEARHKQDQYEEGGDCQDLWSVEIRHCQSPKTFSTGPMLSVAVSKPILSDTDVPRAEPTPKATAPYGPRAAPANPNRTPTSDPGLVFTTGRGTEMDAANVRRDFRRALKLVPGIEPADWTPRELRHSFVSLLYASGLGIEDIANLVGHQGTRVTEMVYRHELWPIIQTGATAMDALFEWPATESGDDG